MTKGMINQFSKFGFISIPQEYTKLVRTLNKTPEDFDALARCFNSFKDPESWPEGFGGALIFTGEYLAKDMENLDVESYFIIHPPNKPKIIAGVSFVGKTWNIPDGYYVQLLGVDPVYQKRKFGKALLLHSTNYAFKQKAKLISLHTWAGNLKAMPLYKRQGYKWRPDTTVYMENYIPQILNFSFFNDFFTSLDSWYDAFKPVIDQEPNNEYEDQMLCYEYYFEQKPESLKVWIDRSIGSICGFHLIYGHENFLIKARTPNSEAYIGNEEFPVILQIENYASRVKKVNIKISSSETITLTENRPTINLEIEPSKNYELVFHGKFTSDTDELDFKLFPLLFSEHEITLDISIDGTIFPLKIGKVPINAIKASLVPSNYSTIPNYTTTIPISIQNAMKERMKIQLLIEGGKVIQFPQQLFNIEISHLDTLINIPINVNQSSTIVELTKLTIKTENGEILFKQLIPIQISNESKTLAYKYDQKVFIENKHIRIYIFEKSHPGDNEVFIIDKLRGLKVFGNASILGYPFDSEGSEFYTLPHQHTVLEHENGLILQSSADSQKNLGIHLTRKIFLPNDSGEVYVSWCVENRDNKTKKNLGVQSSVYWWPGEYLRINRIIPHKDGLLNLRELLAFPLDLGKDPNDLQEGWQASIYETGVIGILFDHKKIHQITLGRTFPKIDHKVPEIKPGQVIETSSIIYAFKSTWEEVQKAWRDHYHYSPQNKLERGIPLKSAKQIGLVSPSSGESISRGLIIDLINPELFLQIKTQKNTTLKGIINFSGLENRLSPSMINLPEIKTNNWRIPLEIHPNSEEFISGKMIFDSMTRIYNYPLTIGFYNSSKNVKISREENYSEVSNGFMTFCGSETYRGQLFSLVLKNENENILHTGAVLFPEVKPYLWWNLFYGGIGTLLRPPNNQNEVGYNTLKWHSYEASWSKWMGIGFESDIITYNNRIKGLQIKNEYLTLPNSQFLLVSSYIKNHSSVPRECFFQVRCGLKTSNSTYDYYYLMVDRQLTSYHLQEHESNVWLERDPLGTFAAFKNHQSNHYIGTVLPRRQFHEAIVTYAPNLKFFAFITTIDNLEVKGNTTLRFDTLYLITKDLSSIEPFTQSNLLDL